MTDFGRKRRVFVRVLSVRVVLLGVRRWLSSLDCFRRKYLRLRQPVNVISLAALMQQAIRLVCLCCSSLRDGVRREVRGRWQRVSLGPRT